MNWREKVTHWGKSLLEQPLLKALIRLSQRRAFQIAQKVILGSLILFFLVYAIYTNWEELQEYKWTLNYRYLLLASLVYGPSFLLVLLAWHRIMADISAMPSLSVNARIYCSSSLFKRIPGVVWYIADRVRLYKKEGVARSVTVVSVALETVLLIITGVLTYLISLLFSVSAKTMGHVPLHVILIILVPLLILIYPANFNRLVSYLLRKLHHQGDVSLTLKSSIRLILIYLIAWIIGGLDLYLLANAVYPVPPELLPAVVGAWAVSGAVSLVSSYLIQGMGVQEVVLSVLLASYLPLPVSIVITILFRILVTIGEVFWALLLLGGLKAWDNSHPQVQAEGPLSTPSPETEN